MLSFPGGNRTPIGESISNKSRVIVSNNSQICGLSFAKVSPLSSSSTTVSKRRFPPKAQVYAKTYTFPRKLKSWEGLRCMKDTFRIGMISCSESSANVTALAEVVSDNSAPSSATLGASLAGKPPWLYMISKKPLIILQRVETMLRSGAMMYCSWL